VLQTVRPSTLPYASPARPVAPRAAARDASRGTVSGSTTDAATSREAAATITSPVAAGHDRGGWFLASAVVASLGIHVGLLLWASVRPPATARLVPTPADALVAAVAFDVHLPTPAPVEQAKTAEAAIVEAKNVEAKNAEARVAEAPTPAPAAPPAPAPRPVARRPKPATTTAKAAPAPTPAPIASPDVAVATAGPGTVEVAAEAGAQQGEETAPAVPAAVLPPPAGSGRATPRVGASGEGFDLGGYVRAMGSRVARQQRYPAEASDRGWQGTVEVRVIVGRDGQLVGAPEIVRSSGHGALDREALRMVRAAAPFRAMPASAGDETVQVVLPIEFVLEDAGDF